jgi:hypothetical protein
MRRKTWSGVGMAGPKPKKIIDTISVLNFAPPRATVFKFAEKKIKK